MGPSISALTIPEVDLGLETIQFAIRRTEARPRAVDTEETALILTERFLQLVEAHYLTISSVADYAAKLYVTTTHLVETVLGTTGQPAGRIIRERLLLEAEHLLRYSDVPIAEIAAYLNFEDPAYVGRYFKKHTGFSPADFREQAEGESARTPR